ncbi:MAG: two-component regulator propeller domain-containing protein [Salinivirgaceae bacterium]
MTVKIVAVFLIFLSSTLGFSQIPKGTWREHLPYNQGHTLALTNDRVYCATDLAVFYYNKPDGRLNKLSKINVLSDLGVGYIAYNPEFNKLLIAYTNGNLDLFTDDVKTNFPDIKQKNMIADKAIYHINFFEDYAYLSCGFGIVVFNLLKDEISDTYIIGTGGSYLKVSGTAVYNDTLYATTDKGIYRAAMSNPFLSNFENWELVSDLLSPNGTYFSPVLFDDKLYVLNPTTIVDNTLVCEYNGQKWDTVLTHLKQVSNLAVSENKLTVVKQYHVHTYEAGLQQTGLFSAHEARHGLYDSEGILWIADAKNGLLSHSETNYKSVYLPEGPENSNIFELYYNRGELLVAPGGHRRTGENAYYKADVFEFQDENWQSLLTNNWDSLINLRDVSTITGTSPGNYVAGTWGYGAIQVADHKVSKIWTAENTQGHLNNFIGGCAYDKGGNLWLANRTSDYPFVVKTPDNNWYSYAYNGAFSNKTISKIICTSQNNLWAVSNRNDGVFVWNSNNTPAIESDDAYRHFFLRDADGMLSNEIYSIVEDKEGAIWMGTANGVVVYDNPNRVFDNNVIYGRVPQLVVDGYLKDLLEGEVVTSIVVDGANRKWLGTAGGGLFLVSADGTKELLVWNTDNSRLLSNQIMALEMDTQTGELFIGTDKGLQSFMGTATDARSDFSAIYAFPNPVKEGYNGTITIRGLMYQTNVKITDLAGHLVYETISNGGDAVWNGRDMSGDAVQSGIYLVLCTTAEGEQAEATKILIVK